MTQDNQLNLTINVNEVRGLIYMLNTHKSMIVYPCATAYLLIEPQIKMKNGQDMLILYGNE